MKTSILLRLFSTFLLLVIVAVGCGSQGGEGSKTAETKKGGSKRSRRAPPFQLVDIQGNAFSLADFKGKVVFLDFWATWCPPCVISSPEVEKIAADYKGKPVEVVSISLDDSEAPVKKFIQERHITNRVALVGDSDVSEKYKIHGIPAFFIIDQEGNLAGVWRGYNLTFPRVWREELDRLLET